MRKKTTLSFLLIAGLTLAAFATSLDNGFVNWDDPPYVIDNYSIRSLSPRNLAGLFTTPRSGYYAPLVFLSYAGEFFFWELNPFAYHLTNLLLHVLNSLLVFVIIRLLGKKTAAALLVALLFAVHPLHVESVAWITERKDVLSAFFYLLAVLGYIKSLGACPSNGFRRVSSAGWPDARRGDAGDVERIVEESATPQTAARRRNPLGSGRLRARDHYSGRLLTRYYLFSLGSFILALLGKPMAVTLPPVLLLIDYYLYSRENAQEAQNLPQPRPLFKLPIRKGGQILRIIPFFGLGLIFGLIAFSLQKSAGTIRPGFHLDLLPHILTAVRNFFFYPVKLLFPFKLSAYYPYPPAINAFLPAFFIPTALVIAAFLLVFRCRKADPGLFFGFAFYTLTILPVLQLIPAGSVIFADRFSYLPSIGIFFLTISLLRSGKTRLLAGVLVLIVLCFSILTFRRCRVWRESKTLWRDTIRKYPTVPTAHLNLGEVLLREGEFEAAIESFRRSRELDPGQVNVYSNLGDAYLKLGFPEEAEKEFITALELDPDDPIVHNNLGLVYARQGKLERAGEEFSTAISLKADYAEPHNNLGLIFRQTGKLARGIEEFEKAIVINSLYRDAYHNLAGAWEEAGEVERAVINYRRAIELKPDFAPAYVDLGFAYAKLGRLPEAAAEFERAVELDPASAPGHYGLALCYFYRGNNKAAVKHRDRAIELGYPNIPREIMELK